MARMEGAPNEGAGCRIRRRRSRSYIHQSIQFCEGFTSQIGLCANSAAAVPTLDLVPACGDFLLHGLGKSHEVEACRQLVAVLVGPVEEFEGFLGGCGIRRLLVDKNEGCACDGPRFRASL